MAAINLTGLYPQAYEHPDDASALDALKHTPAIEAVIRKVNEWSLERMLRIQLTGSYLRVTEAGLPDLWQLLVTARDRISLPITPEFYIKSDEELNAFTTGTKQPVVVVNSGLIGALDEDELLFVIAHELGHIKSGHVLYYQLASYLPVLGGVVGEFTLGIGNLLTQGMQIALLHWQRTSELTADRAGLLACQEPDVALRAMMKLAGLPHRYSGKMNVAHFIKQAEQFESYDASMPDKIAKALSIYGATHPWTVMRAKELVRWIEGGGYNHVLSMAPFSPRPAQPSEKSCPSCGTKAYANDMFCNKCGQRLPGSA